MKKMLLELSFEEIQYFKRYLMTLNEKFSDRTFLDNFFEKISVKKFDDVCKTVKRNVEKFDNMNENHKLDIFSTSTELRLSPDYETFPESCYIKYLNRLIFFRFGKKLVFKDFDTEHFEKTFKLKPTNEIFEKHLQKFVGLNKLFSPLVLKETTVKIDSEELLNDDMWLGIPISKNNSKEFNQMMLSLWCYVESSC